MAEELFRHDSYLRQCEARIIEVGPLGFYVDRTVFYPMGGGQPGDCGSVHLQDGRKVRIADTIKNKETGDILHVLDDQGDPIEKGERVILALDWDRRYRLMRMHSCMHLLCAVIPAGVTGGSVRDGSARLDFDLPTPPDKKQIEDSLNRLIEEDHRMSLQWITDQELAEQPELVRTMSVSPPLGTGRVRLVRFQDVDLQPCGGTHVASTAEIGRIQVKKIEKKGKRNRRITVEFAHA